MSAFHSANRRRDAVAPSAQPHRPRGVLPARSQRGSGIGPSRPWRRYVAIQWRTRRVVACASRHHAATRRAADRVASPAQGWHHHRSPASTHDQLAASLSSPAPLYAGHCGYRQMGLVNGFATLLADVAGVR